jgi:2'-hydroxyisoflavone reductase
MSSLLVLGGTGWLGRQVAQAALVRGTSVTCLARGASGATPEGARLVVADRSEPGAYAAVSGQDWDAVIDVAWQPGLVAGALAALGERVAHWTLVSSCSVYARADVPGEDESAATLEPFDGPLAPLADYGRAKAACERLVGQAVGERALLARAGLIGGPGDPSDRFGYWPARFARDRRPVLIPDEPDMSTQTVDVRDLAAWLVGAAARGVTGAVNAVGESVTLGRLLSLSADATAATAGHAGHAGPVVPVPPAWLEAEGVEPWSGPRSLPMWLPMPDYAGFMARADARALATGLERRPVEETLADVVLDERRRGTGRARGAGLTAVEEADLLARWQRSA